MNDREMSCNSGGQFMDRGRMNQNGVVQPLLTGKYDFAFNGVDGGLSHLVAKIDCISIKKFEYMEKPFFSLIHTLSFS